MGGWVSGKEVPEQIGGNPVPYPRKKALRERNPSGTSPRRRRKEEASSWQGGVKTRNLPGESCIFAEAERDLPDTRGKGYGGTIGETMRSTPTTILRKKKKGGKEIEEVYS